ncbi:hypothetical protein KGF54_003392 [Candida jiufengensis]|uniref:uncharacterized protein n=1 Tax=Candida jiufengensis TaxID=497108 RepID=UPI002225B466|nr:uncharacterized protein KGF54_003392 [Candida jiufengensis]KAI5952525.1 hypothetical protein KGF54_003392 [Candida jiufengensis]
MATVSLNITYLTTSKKFTASKSQTISQLVSQCLTGFKIDSTTYTGDLYHNDKILDSSTPIRLTNLINNSKLTLKLKKIDINKEINVKFTSSKGTSISKFNATTTLKQLVESFKYPIKNTQLRILNLTIDFINYEKTTLGSIVGNANSVVIRIEEIKSKTQIAELNKKQEEANQLYIQQELARKKLEEEKLAKERKEQEHREEYAQTHDELKKTTTNEENEDVEMTDVEQPPTSQDNPNLIVSDIPSKQNNTESAELIESSSSYVYKEEEFQETPQLYIPSSTSNNSNQQQYQNPDEDYNMTVNQAKTYQNVIRASAKRTKPKDSKLPTKYLIRIKFPDGSILQLNFLENINSLKFGQFIKRIDDLLLPQFLNNYNLKLGYPPFTKLTQSFTTNNELLINLKEFQNEQIILIWENSLASKGPFLNNTSQDLIIKAKDELPERKLEKNRSLLPDDNHHKSKSFFGKSKSSANDNDGDEDKKKSKLSKWLKISKK